MSEKKQPTTKELLEKVNRQIHNMEVLSKNKPEYYEACMKEHHEVFIRLQKELKDILAEKELKAQLKNKPQ